MTKINISIIVIIREEISRYQGQEEDKTTRGEEENTPIAQEEGITNMIAEMGLTLRIRVGEVTMRTGTSIKTGLVLARSVSRGPSKEEVPSTMKSFTRESIYMTSVPMRSQSSYLSKSN